MIPELLGAVALSFGIVLPIWIALRVVSARKATTAGQPLDVRRELLLFVFVAYVVAVATVTIVPLNALGGHGAGQINLVPFRTIMQCVRETLQTPSDLLTRCIANFLGNIALLFPFGLLASLVFAKLWSWHRVLGAALVISVSIETIQLLEGAIGGIRSVDIDDAVLNVLGALLGYLSLVILRGAATHK